MTVKFKFQDEFPGKDGSAPNPALWNEETGFVGTPGELETYTSSRLNSYQDGQGHLVINAMATGRSTYTSARLTTQNKFAMDVGTFSARVKVDPHALGTWPALWLLGADYPSAGWPQCGEIDLMECFGGGADWDPQTSIHAPGLDLDNDLSLDDGWHHYEVTISKIGTLVFRLDGQVYWTVSQSTDRSEGASAWPFGPEKPMFFILNMAIGGEGGGTVPPDFQSAQMLVDYVHAW